MGGFWVPEAGGHSGQSVVRPKEEPGASLLVDSSQLETQAPSEPSSPFQSPECRLLWGSAGGGRAGIVMESLKPTPWGEGLLQTCPGQAKHLVCL